MKGCLWIVTLLLASLCGIAGCIGVAAVGVSADGPTKFELLGASLISALIGAFPGGLLLVVAHFTETPEPADPRSHSPPRNHETKTPAT